MPQLSLMFADARAGVCSFRVGASRTANTNAERKRKRVCTKVEQPGGTRPRKLSTKYRRCCFVCVWHTVTVWCSQARLRSCGIRWPRSQLRACTPRFRPQHCCALRAVAVAAPEVVLAAAADRGRDGGGGGGRGGRCGGGADGVTTQVREVQVCPQCSKRVLGRHTAAPGDTWPTGRPAHGTATLTASACGCSQPHQGGR